MTFLYISEADFSIQLLVPNRTDGADINAIDFFSAEKLSFVSYVAYIFFYRLKYQSICLQVAYD